MPLLGVDLPLKAFYLFAPPLFLLLHFYVLMQFYLLTRMLRQFDSVLRAVPTMFKADRSLVLAQLDSFVLTRMLLGGPDRFLPRQFLAATVWVTLLLGPVVLLLFVQLRFLPYHLEFATWDHRLTLMFDIFLVWLVGPWIAVGAGRTRRWETRSVILGGAGALLVLFSMTVATIPDELFDRWHPSWWPTPWLFDGPLSDDPELTSDRTSRSLVVTDVSVTGLDNHQLSRTDKTIVLRGRDMRYALLARADLRKADLAYARLQHATLYFMKLEGADLTGARLACARLTSVGLLGTTLDGLHAIGANLSSAVLSGVIVKGGDLTKANLISADLAKAKLDGTIFTGARLCHADLTNAKLFSADLTQSNLTDANLTGASLASADLKDADLTGTNLTDADLRGVRNLKQEQLDKACGTGTKLGGGLVMNKSCPTVDANNSPAPDNSAYITCQTIKDYICHAEDE